MTRRAFVVRHVHFEDLGLLAPLLAARGFEIEVHEAWNADFDAAADAGLVVLLGGPISVNDTRDYPFVDREIALARSRIGRDRPLLGLCLGAQVIARAAGGSVGPGPEKEIGWAPLRLSEPGLASPLVHLQGVSVLHWHGEVCVLPDDIPSLASTAACRNQAFQVGDRCLGLQFHAEAGTGGLEPWLVGHALEIEQTDGVSVRRLRSDTDTHGPALKEAGSRFFNAWLDAVGL
jgi:GMP synthase (glutamine-hydrolysing)